MANTKISQLTLNANPNGGEELVYAYNNTNGKMTLNTMKAFATANTQEELVSWTNIKTINWNSILWSWNLVISWWGWGDWQVIFDCIVDAAGNWDYTTLWAAITAGNRNIFIREWVYNESPITLVDDSFTIVWANVEWVILNYSITAWSWSAWGWCIMFSTSTKVNKTDIINHSISWVTFNISEVWTSNGHRWYLINMNWTSDNPMCSVDINDCNIIVSQSWASVYFCNILGSTNTICNIYSSYMSISNSSTSYDSSYRGCTKWLCNHIWCNIVVSSTSDGYVYAQPSSNYNTFQECNITIENKWTWKADATIYNADNCNISVIWTANWTATYSIQKSTKCNITVTKPLSDLKWMTAATEVNAWASSTSYSVWQFVEESDIVYCCKEAHTSWNDFDYDKRDRISWQFLLNNIWCTASWWLSIFMWHNVWCVVDCDNALVVWDTWNKSEWAKVLWTTIKTAAWFVKLIWWASTFCWNTVRSRVWVRYQDFYNIIKDNVLTSDVSSSQNVTLVWTNNNNSKVSDNILRQR